MILPQQFKELLAMLDADAGRSHSQSGAVSSSLARILNRHEEMLSAEPTPDRQPSDAAVEAVVLDEEFEAQVMDAFQSHGDLMGGLLAVYALGRDQGSALVAAYRVDAPRPLLDRDALGRALISFGADVRLDPAQPAEMFGMAVDAVMELARPMPTQSELTDWLRDIFVTDADPEGTSWETAAELLLDLLNGPKS